jgi:CubicO group peptidase (beta-lactamase class C family)
MSMARTPWLSPLIAVSMAAQLSAPSPGVAADPAVRSAAAIARIMETFARPPVDSGAAVGIAVGVTFRGRSPQFFSYGTANVLDGTAVTPDTIFEMGSVTKVFTTALLGEAALAGDLKLKLPLSRLETLLGTMPLSTQKVTLLNLGDFTAGLTVDIPPECPPPPVPLMGCIPNLRPTISQYGAQDLLDYFRTFSAPRMPGPYFYSDISTGLIGLILGSSPDAPMSDAAIHGWIDLVRHRITEPLGMTDTFLFDHDASPSQRARLARGYSQPVVGATASGGGLVILGFAGGTGYSTAPPATVVGGGGSGAEVTVTVGGDSITGIKVKQPGQGYIAPPEVVFGGHVTTPATGQAIISNRQVIGISIRSRGESIPRRSP